MQYTYVVRYLLSRSLSKNGIVSYYIRLFMILLCKYHENFM